MAGSLAAVGELPDQVVQFVAAQVRVAAADLGLYECRTIEFHRAQIRDHLGFRECSVEDAEKLTAWLASEVCEAERQADAVRQELLARCRTERVEPPTSGRVDRIVRSALHQAEVTLALRIAGRLPAATATRLEQLVAVDVDVDDGSEESVLALVKAVPGNVSLESMLTEIRKLRAVRAIGLPTGLFGDVAPKGEQPAHRRGDGERHRRDPRQPGPAQLQRLGPQGLTHRLLPGPHRPYAGSRSPGPHARQPAGSVGNPP